MRILHYVDEGDLSWAVSWLQLLKALEGLGVENQVVCKGGGSLLRMLENQGIPVHGYAPPVQWCPPLARGLKALIEKLSPHIVHTRLSAAAFLGGYWGKKLNLPVLQTVDKFPKAKYHRDATALLPCSSAVADHMARQGFPAERIQVVPNGIDRAHFRRDSAAGQSWRQSLGLGQEALVVLGAGRFVDWKGFDDLIAAFALALASPDFAAADPWLVLVGGGEEEKALRRLAAGSAAAGRIKFFSFAQDVRPFMWAADVFVQPSRMEPFGVVLLEAMASSLACIGCCRGGTTDLIEDQVSGLLVPVGSPEAMAERIKDCCLTPGLRQRLAQAAWERSALFDISAVAARTLEVYRSALAGDYIGRSGERIAPRQNWLGRSIP